MRITFLYYRVFILSDKGRLSLAAVTLLRIWADACVTLICYTSWQEVETDTSHIK
jgi:hypothetical protein